MWSRKKKKEAEKAEKSRPDKGGATHKKDLEVAAEKQGALGQWKQQHRTSYRKFPGPSHVDVVLRVAFERPAYADFIAHARRSLDAEICGVLVGLVHEDEEGPFVHVQAIIEGEQAREESTHVTFTQETWTTIHQTLESTYPKLQIVGWYHTHPGFGVEFSDMDLFIQQNFFPSPTQIALLTDPLSGAVAVCVNTAEGIQLLNRFWVEGREVRCQAPSPRAEAQTEDSALNIAFISRDLQALEARLDRYTQTVMDHQSKLQAFALFIGMAVLVAVLAWVGHAIYTSYTTDRQQAIIENLRTVPVPVRIGAQTVILEVQIVGVWRASSASEPAPQTQPQATAPPADTSATGGNPP